jgi:hypothetical protein
MLGFRSSEEFEHGRASQVVIIYRGEMSDMFFGTSIDMICGAFTDTSIIIALEVRPADVRAFSGVLGARAGDGVVVCLRAWHEGWTVTYDGPWRTRFATGRVAELLRPLGTVATGREVVAGIGPFERPARGEAYVLLAMPGAILLDMSCDDKVVAADLRFLSTPTVPLFTQCYQLRFIHFPTTLERILPHSFSSCAALAAADLSACVGLTVVGEYAFSGCGRLGRIDLPPCVELVGAYAFAASGLEHVRAPAGRITIEVAAFLGCAALVTAHFNVVEFEPFVFCGCACLEVLVAREIAACDHLWLAGSGVKKVRAECSRPFSREFMDVMTPPCTVSRAAGRA